MILTEFEVINTYLYNPKYQFYMKKKDYFKVNKTVLLIVTIWLAIYAIAVAYTFMTAPITCYNHPIPIDVLNPEPVTSGGCQPNYALAASSLTYPTIIWALVLVIALLTWKLKKK